MPLFLSPLENVTYNFNRPGTIKIYNYDINPMVCAAQVAEDLQPNFIDIDFACPMK